MVGVPDAAAWSTFTQIGVVLIFLLTLVGAVWRVLAVRRGVTEPRPGQREPKAGDVATPSPEALALIEATRALIEGMQCVTERSEATGRMHKRLDDVNREMGASRSEVAEVRGQLVQMNKTLHLIHEHLLRQK